MESPRLSDNTLFLSGELGFDTIPRLSEQVHSLLKREKPDRIDISQVTGLDSAGVAWLESILDYLQSEVTGAEICGASETHRALLSTFSGREVPVGTPPVRAGWFEQVGGNLYSGLQGFGCALIMAADVFYWSFRGLVSRRGQKKGATVQQAFLLGVQALPVVGLLSLILGFIMSLQSAVQLRNFGANIFLADALAISFVRELGPMITAIIVAGRSGSAIASEIASMQVSEEIDALRMMAINPIRYVVVPKFHAMSLVLPILVAFSILIGLLSGLLIGLSYLEVSLQTFVSRMVEALTLKDIVICFGKSLFFAWVIVIISSYYGFSVRGGAEDVGQATTNSVVASIIAIVFFDSVFSLVYL